MERIKVSTSHLMGDIKIKVGIGNSFATNLFQETLYNNDYLERFKEENISSIIDYEKKTFVPVSFKKDFAIRNSCDILAYNQLPELLDSTSPSGFTQDNLDEEMVEVNKIRFNLFFRDRPYTEMLFSADTSVVYPYALDFGNWSTSDEKFWNAFVYHYSGETSGETITPPSTTLDGEPIRKPEFMPNGDRLGYLGFDDEDVFYQKKALLKSFIRISVYDTPYAENQQLLFYATLFFDTNKLYSNYTKACNDGSAKTDRRSIYNNVVFTSDDLTATFTCTNKYDNSSSSDGFYLYLYDTITNGENCTKLYMKVEFNNAKYGVTVPLTYQQTDNFIPIIPTDYNKDKEFTQNFRIDYAKRNDEGKAVDVNMEQLYKDLYIPIYVKYNKEMKQFVWFLGTREQTKITEDGEIKINLYEPRINTTELNK